VNGYYYSSEAAIEAFALEYHAMGQEQRKSIDETLIMEYTQDIIEGQDKFAMAEKKLYDSVSIKPIEEAVSNKEKVNPDPDDDEF